MSGNRSLAAAAAALSLAGCATASAPTAPAAEQRAAWAARCADDSGWDDPGPPYRVFGNTWYVGTCGIAALLVTGDAGHVLIDTGTETGADLVQANIRALGFDPRDVKVVLMTHEHGDHVGGMARLQQATGARLFASPEAAKVMASGTLSSADPQFSPELTQAPARVDGEVHDGVPVHLGTLALTPMATPGHTPGATSWFWRSCDGADCRTIVYADSLTPVSRAGYRFSDHPAYVAEFRRSLARLAQLDCDLLVTPHPSASAMRTRLAGGDLTDPAACAAYAASRGDLLDARLAQEARGD